MKESQTYTASVNDADSDKGSENESVAEKRHDMV